MSSPWARESGARRAEATPSSRSPKSPVGPALAQAGRGSHADALAGASPRRADASPHAGRGLFSRIFGGSPTVPEEPTAIATRTADCATPRYTAPTAASAERSAQVSGVKRASPRAKASPRRNSRPTVSPRLDALAQPKGRLHADFAAHSKAPDARADTSAKRTASVTDPEREKPLVSPSVAATSTQSVAGAARTDATVPSSSLLGMAATATPLFAGAASVSAPFQQASVRPAGSGAAVPSMAELLREGGDTAVHTSSPRVFEFLRGIDIPSALRPPPQTPQLFTFHPSPTSGRGSRAPSADGRDKLSPISSPRALLGLPYVNDAPSSGGDPSTPLNRGTLAPRPGTKTKDGDLSDAPSWWRQRPAKKTRASSKDAWTQAGGDFSESHANSRVESGSGDLIRRSTRVPNTIVATTGEGDQCCVMHQDSLQGKHSALVLSEVELVQTDGGGGGEEEEELTDLMQSEIRAISSATWRAAIPPGPHSLNEEEGDETLATDAGLSDWKADPMPMVAIMSFEDGVTGRKKQPLLALSLLVSTPRSLSLSLSLSPNAAHEIGTAVKEFLLAAWPTAAIVTLATMTSHDGFSWRSHCLACAGRLGVSFES